MKLKIPKSFKLFSSTINIKFDNEKCQIEDLLGECNLDDKLIVLSNSKNFKPLPEDTIIDTFYHEKVHMLLKALNRRELSSDEIFVDNLAMLLRQSDETTIY
jgi:hypothetical protein